MSEAERLLVDLGANDAYLERGADWIGPSGHERADLMALFRLETPLKAMGEASLPDGHKHLLRGLGLSNSNAELISKYSTNVSLLSVLEGVAFGRPIEPIPDHVIQKGFQFPTTTPVPGAVHTKASSSSGHGPRSGLVHPPPSFTDKSSVVASSADGLTEKEKKELKKKEKKKKRERDDAETLKTVLVPFLQELKAMSWKKWPIKGKPGNPFIEKYTRENCKVLGVPNYFDYITTPMDLTRIGEKIQRMEYVELSQLTADINLLVANAETFNGSDSTVFQMALEFKKVYDEKLTVYKTIYDDVYQEKKKRKKEKKKKKDKKKDK
ncbi:hypothetical protein ACHHYP_08678 [Achlya hypogyna]|uniref:Bromo domain-containing protein n=1 Tax=Achlya hypogyna TaxID=1202772 RepID=A0A1V9ZK60_ACHHY|nr:hypothetical protein ACHHYP_08678 [Achlya hypogyna]